MWNRFFVIGLILAALGAFPMQSHATGFQFSGQLLNSDGTPVTGTQSVEFDIQNGDCIVYSETQTITFSPTGRWTALVGSAPGAGKRNVRDTGHPWPQVFQNAAPLNGKHATSGSTCVAAAGSTLRAMVLTVSGQKFSPGVALTAAPTATVAETIAGYGINNLAVLGSGDLTQANLQSVFATGNAAKLNTLLSWDPNSYVRSNAAGVQLPNLSTPSSPQAGQIWYDSGTIKFWNGSSAQTLGVSGAGITSLVAGTGLNVGAGPGGSITTSGTLNVDVGTTANKILQLDGSGSLPAIGGSNLTSLDANSLTTGTVPLARLPANIARNDQANVMTGPLTLPANGLTVGNASSLSNEASVVSQSNGLARFVVGNSGFQSFSMIANNRGTAFEGVPSGTASLHTGNSVPLVFATNQIERMRIDAAGKVGIGTSAPTAALHLGAGAAAAGSAPLKFTAGTLLTTPEPGAIEFDGTEAYITNGSLARKAIVAVDGAGFSSQLRSLSALTGGITLTPTFGNSVEVNQSTVSTSPSTGALVVGGGAGIGGALHVMGTIHTPKVAGGTAASGDLTLDSTTNPTKGRILINPTGGSVGIGTASPVGGSLLDVNGQIKSGSLLTSYGNSTGYVANESSPFLSGPTGVAIYNFNNQNLSMAPIRFQVTNGSPQYAHITAVAQAGSSPSLAFGTQDSASSYSEKLRIHSNGKIGIRNADPTADLAILGVAPAEIQLQRQATSSQSTPNSNSIFGRLLFAGRDNSSSSINGASIVGWQDGVETSGAVPSAITIKTGSSTGGDDRVTIRSNGMVGIGTTAPSHQLHVVGNLRVHGTTDCTLGNGTSGTNCSSDIRLKENIQPISNVLEKIHAIRGVEFDWIGRKNESHRHAIGVIAQEVEQQFPTVVITDPKTTMKKVDYAALVAPLIEAIKELNAKITTLEQSETHAKAKAEQLASYLAAKESENTRILRENAELKARMERIEKAMGLQQQF